MKNILAINTANSGGGAEKVGYILAKELRARGYVSHLLSRRIDYGADSAAADIVVPVPGTRAAYALGTTIDRLCSTDSLFYWPTFAIPRMEQFRQADVVHLHNLHGYYFNTLAIPYVMARKPVVWTFHDMWPITGKCAWSFDCTRFEDRCGACPQLTSYPATRHDTTALILKLKKRLYANRRFVIVTPSEWLRTQVSRSILKDVPAVVIPSPVDTATFFPEDRLLARKRLGIPDDAKVVLFVASWINSISHKGVDAFKEMLTQLGASRHKVFAVVVGHLEGRSVLGAEFAGLETGWLDDQATLRSCYAAADVYVSPTTAENSSCTIMEAMACGTPVVAYATGGVPEQIVDGETGFLVEPGNRRELMERVLTLLSDDDMAARLGAASASRAASRYSLDRFVTQYLNAYQRAVDLRAAGQDV